MFVCVILEVVIEIKKRKFNHNVIIHFFLSDYYRADIIDEIYFHYLNVRLLYICVYI